MAVPPLGPGHGPHIEHREGRKPGDPGSAGVAVVWTWSAELEEWIGIVDKSPAKITARIWTNEVGLASWEIANGEASEFRTGVTYRVGVSATADQAKLDIEDVVNMRWVEWETGKPKMSGRARR